METQSATMAFTTPELPKVLYEELGAAIRGNVYLRNDPNYWEYIKMFNGNIKTEAKAVVCPLDTEDISKTVLFCVKHSLSPSIKAGGYGTAGWAVAGDIVVDMSRFTDIDIEAPTPSGEFTSLRDMPSVGDKGKNQTGPDSSGGKRRRDDDADLRTYDAASLAVASFLRGPPLTSDEQDHPSPNVRRRVDPSATPELLPSTRQLSDESSTSKTSSTSGSGASLSSSTSTEGSRNPTSATATSPSPPAPNPANKSTDVSSASAGADPFGYLGDSPSFSSIPPQNVVSPAYPSNVTLRSWGAGASSAFATPGLAASPHNLLTRAVPIYPTAYVTFGAGKRQKEVDQYTAAHPFEATSLSGQRGVIPYHVPFAAHPVGSSNMLQAGFGFLGRLHGLSIDNLVEVEMVLADGRVVIVSEKEHPDLWWALRGAGTAFGVATRYKTKAYPVPVVFAGNLIYRFHRSTAPSLIKHFRDCIKGAPRELYANIILTAGPAGKDSLVVIQMCYIGTREMGQEYLHAISSWDGERCLLNEVDEKSFLNQQDSVAQVLRGKAGRQWFIRSALITSLPDEAINKTVIQFADAPVGCTWLFELAGGAIVDFEDTCLPKSQREASFTIAALHQWEMGVDDPRCIASAEEWIKGTLATVTAGGPYPSFLARHEPADRTISSYGNNWSRLVELKQLYDPKNLFRNSFWPLNAEGQSVEPQTHEPATP